MHSHSELELSLEQDAASCTITHRDKESTKCRSHRNGKPQRKKALRLAKRQKGEVAKRRPSHIGLVGLRENPLQHFRRNTRNRQIRCNKCKCVSTSKGSKFEHRFSNPFSSIFNAEDLGASIKCWNDECTFAISKGKTLSWPANSLHNGANCFPISRSSKDLDWRTAIFVLVQQKGLLIE